jgi:hypothetical protein
MLLCLPGIMRGGRRMEKRVISLSFFEFFDAGHGTAAQHARQT